MLFAFFRIQLECIHCPCIKVLCRSSTFTNSLIIHVTRHMSALDQLKHSCTINWGGSSFPVLVRENLSNFVKNLQTSSCFYRSSNHGLTQSSHQVFNYVAVTKLKWRWPAHGCIFVAEFPKFRWAYRIYNLTLFLWIHKASLKFLRLTRKEAPYYFSHRP